MIHSAVSTLGERIKHIRKLLALKQKEFAEGLNISVQSLSDIENDKTKPCHDFFFNMGNVFQVNLYFLFFGEGEPFAKHENNHKSIGISTEEILIRYREHFSEGDVSEFLMILSCSRVIRYEILGFFERLKSSDDAFIKKDFERLLKESKK